MDIPTRGSVYAAMKQAFREKPQQAKTFSAQKATKLDYEVGDTVRHIKFGVGIVTDIVDGGRDYEVYRQLRPGWYKENVCFVCKTEKVIRRTRACRKTKFRHALFSTDASDAQVVIRVE